MTKSNSGGAASAPAESDFSIRKIGIASICLIGGLLGTSLLPFGALAFAMLPMTHEFNWSRTEFSGATTALMWFGSLSVPTLGRISDKVGVRPVILIGTTMVGLVTLAVAHNGGHVLFFWGCFALLGVFGSSGVAYQKVIASLFTQHRGKALAIFGAESALVMAISPLITNFLVQNYGWRGMYTVYGFLILAIVPLVFFTLPEPGAEAGKSAWRKAKGPVPQGALKGPPMMAADGMSASEALRDKVFWLMVIASIVGMAPASGMMNHMIAAMTDKGFSATLAASISSFALLLGVGWTLMGGFLADKVQTARINIPFLIASAVGVFLFAIVTPSMGGVLLLVAAYSLQGIGLTAGRPMTTYFQTRFFGLRAFTEISGFQSAPLSLSMGFAAPLMGRIYDTTGSYNMAFTIMIVGMLISAVLYLTLGRYRYSADSMLKPLPPESAVEAAGEVVTVAAE